MKYLEYWILSDLCNGMNIYDIARLKYKDIDNESIKFIRKKTERTNRQNLKPVVVPITPEITAIINRWGTKPQLPENFIFPILKPNLNAVDERKTVNFCTSQIILYTNKIATLVGIKKHITSYSARHSYATVMKRSGASIEFISESLGHSNLQTTESYLGSFELETKRKHAKALINFKIPTSNGKSHS